MQADWFYSHTRKPENTMISAWGPEEKWSEQRVWRLSIRIFRKRISGASYREILDRITESLWERLGEGIIKRCSLWFSGWMLETLAVTLEFHRTCTSQGDMFIPCPAKISDKTVLKKCTWVCTKAFNSKRRIASLTKTKNQH